MSIIGKRNDFQAIIQELESKMTPEVKKDYEKLVNAGLQYGLANGKDGLMAMLQRSADPVNASALGAVNLVTKYLPAAAKGRPQPVAMVYASKTLMFLALEFVDRAGIAKIGTDEIVRAEHIWVNNIFKAFNISPEKLNKAASMAHGVTNNPMHMERLNLATGYAKDPRASTYMADSEPDVMTEKPEKAEKSAKSAKKEAV